MNWLNIEANFLDSEAYVCATDTEQATWWRLLRYCAGQENGGVIPGAKDWTGTKWQVLCRVKAAVVKRASALWKWDGADLMVLFYPLDREEEVKKRRAGAIKTNAKKQPQRPAERGAQRGAEPPAECHGKIREDKTSQGKERKDKGGVNFPSLEDAIAYFDKQGSGYSSDEIRVEWFKACADQVEGSWVSFNPRFPHDRKKWARVEDWRAFLGSRLARARVQATQKKEAPASGGGKVTFAMIDQQAKEVDRLKKEQDAARDSSGSDFHPDVKAYDAKIEAAEATLRQMKGEVA